MSVCVCTLVHGQRRYFTAAAQSVRSVLANSDFDVFVAYDGPHAEPLPNGERITFHQIDEPLPSDHRAHRFLRKFRALASLLAQGKYDHILLLDADAIVVRPLKEADMVQSLAGHPIGMVEQKGITGSNMGRPQFLEHYKKHSMQLVCPDLPPPDIATFRFFNSGVVLGKADHLQRLASWAIQVMDSHEGEFQVGEHMVADQDLFQVWTNTVEPGCCIELPWYWNHCEHWDANFPKLGALIVHFSNFCCGPANDTVERMRGLRRRLPRFAHSLVGPYAARWST